MNTSDILYAAADHIERFGHHKGAGLAPGRAPSIAPACTIGAITLVAELGDAGHLNLDAQSAMSAHVGRFIIDWNDAPERTAVEVVEALRAAAVIEAAKENAAASSEAVSA